jgi:hypothetical protein
MMMTPAAILGPRMSPLCAENVLGWDGKLSGTKVGIKIVTMGMEDVKVGKLVTEKVEVKKGLAVGMDETMKVNVSMGAVVETNVAVMAVGWVLEG